LHAAPDDPRLVKPWMHPVAHVAEALAVDPSRGLAADELQRRRKLFGPNVFRETKPRPALSILLAQLRSIVVLLLFAATGLALLMGDTVEAMAIAVVVALNTALGFTTEWRATRSMESLRSIARTETTVLRGGRAERIPASGLVPGDVVLLEAGDVIPADLRLQEAARMQADESVLTGESLPVRKQVDAVAAEASLLERPNIAFGGTALTRGSGSGLVVATGMDTEFGRIFDQVSTAQPRQTPLEKRLDALGKRLVWLVLVMAVMLAVIGVLTGRDIALAIEVAIALSVAAIPEGLPIVATIALARGMWRMARRNALITRLSAVETLGATSVILTDKTGTLTENRMTVTRVLLADADIVFQSEGDSSGDTGVTHRLLERAALCCNASLGDEAEDEKHATGDPTELALLAAAARLGLDRPALLAAMPELREEPFSAEDKRMATIHRDADGVFAAVKGAPESVLPLCRAQQEGEAAVDLDDAGRQHWLQRADDLAATGLRTLAVAERRLGSEQDPPYSDLVLLGLVGMEDPPRKGVKEAIEQCHAAGVNVVMVTGDHAATAARIALDTGIVAEGQPPQVVDGDALQQVFESEATDELLDVRVFARVTPEQKLKLIDLHQRADRVVAMTGDGVNDAPALKKADIGVAMGIRGTAIARESAAMVLQDDEFRTIVAAIAQGRAIFSNIRKFVVYLMSCNISEVLVVVLATVAGAPLPLLPLQILFLNLVTDVFPVLALGVGTGAPGAMQHPPRSPRERVLMRQHWVLIGLYAALIGAVVLGAMAVGRLVLGFDASKAVTVSFLTLALAQMWHVFNIREDSGRWLRNEITGNPWIWAALGLCSALIAAAVYFPPLAAVLSLVHPGPDGWLLVALASVLPLLLAPVLRRLARRFAPP